MKWRRWVIGLLAGCLFALAGCGAQKNYETDHLTVWIWDESQQEIWSTLAESWGEAHQISVEVVVKDADTYWQELKSGNMPDLFWVDTTHAQDCIDSGLLYPLDEYLEEDKSLQLEDYHSELLPAFQSGDKTYAIPKDSSVTALWYNKTLFDNLGLSYPDETWTWETLYEYAQQLTNRHNGIYGIAIGEEDTTDGWFNLVYAYGGSILSIDEEGNRVSGWGDEATGQAMELLGRLIRDCMPSQPTMAQIGAAQLFADGHVAMLLQSSDEAMALSEQSGAGDWGCALLPYCDRDGNGNCDTGERVSVITGTAWAVSANSADTAAAYDLLIALNGEEGQTAQSTANLAQPAMTGLGEDWGVSLAANFAPYRTILAEGTLIAAPIQLPGENWLDYAISETMYTAWNNPDQMDAMLQKQEQYTASDLTDSAAEGSESDSEMSEETDDAATVEPQDTDAVDDTNGTDGTDNADDTDNADSTDGAETEAADA